MPTIRDVATLAGVSTATVSHVVNNTRRVTVETRCRVEDAIARFGYVPNMTARALARQKGHTHSLNLTEHADEESRVTGEISVAPRQATLRRTDSEQNTFLQPTPTTHAVLKIIRAAQPIARAELAKRLTINRSTVTEIVKPLLASGALRETELPEIPQASRVGRPPVGVELVAEDTGFIGCNIGVRLTQVGAMTISDRMLFEEVFDTASDVSEAMRRISESVSRALSALGERRLAGVGVSVPGPVCGERKRLLYAPHLGWSELNIADLLRAQLEGEYHRAGVHKSQTISDSEVPIVVENDAAAAAVYEARRRLASSAEDAWRDFVLVRAGTGIGVGLVVGGEIYRGVGGTGGLAGEFGHMTIVAGGKLCACGNRGCWERYASASAAAVLYNGDRASTSSTGALRFKEVVARAEAGDRRASATLEQTGEYLGIGIGNVIAGLGVGRVIISGRIVLGWKFLRESLHEALRRTMAGRLASPIVEASAVTGAGLGGALEVAIEESLMRLGTGTRN